MQAAHADIGAARALTTLLGTYEPLAAHANRHFQPIWRGALVQEHTDMEQHASSSQSCPRPQR